jgi:tetratricopeptide (TPR) repeat protein
MPGNRKIYEQTLRRGHNLAWDSRWQDAIREYEKALAQFPNDPVVCNSLGLAYLKTGSPQKAIRAYQEASRLAPDDPTPLNRILDIYKEQGQLQAAADTCMALAETYQRRGVVGQALRAWQQAIELQPDYLPARSNLAETYVDLKQIPRAVREYLQIARMLKDRGQHQKASQICAQALRLDAQNVEAHALMEALKVEGEEALVEEQQPPPTNGGVSPADLAQDRALEELAGIPFEDQPVVAEVEAAEMPTGEGAAPTEPALSRHAVDTLITQAIDFQTRGLLDEAIECYRQAIVAGVDRPAVHFNLGLLYQQRLRFRQAIERLSITVHHSPYTLGSHFALGECFKALGRHDEALEHFLQALKIVDLGTVQRSQADDLIQLYEALAQSYAVKGDRETALEFTNSLIEFFGGKGWEDQARAARHRLDSLSDGITRSLAEMLSVPNAETIFAAIVMSQEYLKRGMEMAATDLCFQAIAKAPFYLPLHERLGEILAEQGQIEAAVAKYEMVADAYLIRGEPHHTISVYKRLLHLSPLDVVVRSRVIDLLLNSGEIDETLEQYLELADAYYQLMQLPKAVEKYNEALRLVPRAPEPHDWQIRVLRRLTELLLRTGDWPSASSSLEALVELCPDDDRARLNLIDALYKAGRGSQADKQTEAMIRRCHAVGDHEQAIGLLTEALRRQPQQMALRGRLARAYMDAGMRDEAVEQLDVLGEMQLEAGLHWHAIATLKAIIALKPANLEAYQELLRQIGG